MEPELTEEEREKEKVQRLVDQCIACIFVHVALFVLMNILLWPPVDWLFAFLFGGERSPKR
jgi:hypothetical protein